MNKVDYIDRDGILSALAEDSIIPREKISLFSTLILLFRDCFA